MRHFYLSITLALTVSCSDNGSNVNEPQPGTVDITTITNGPQPDPDGYSIGLDGMDQGAIGLDASLRIQHVDPGDHAVQLNGVASNCTVSGDNPRTISLTSGGLTPVSFMITCLGTAGGIQVNTETSGTNPDPDGYIVTLDDKDRLRLGINDSATFSGLTLGPHTVGLDDITANCHLQQESPLTITVTGGNTRVVSFRITCI